MRMKKNLHNITILLITIFIYIANNFKYGWVAKSIDFVFKKMSRELISIFIVVYHPSSLQLKLEPEDLTGPL